MARPIETIQSVDRHCYSEVIDVRSPAEFAEDHIPGAKNYFVLDDAQRAEVGTIYKQTSTFDAKKLGASLVSANISNWIATELIDKPRDYHPLVYCWRGGQRSMSFATVLAQIGWEVTVIEGGYKRYRQQVRETLDRAFTNQKIIILSGLTGTAKTEVLKALANRGEQVLDLEQLANHRGSLLGNYAGETQPAQKYFESALADEAKDLDPQRVLWVESESNKIGNLYCPLPLWTAMRQAPQIEISAPLSVRVEFLYESYQALTQDAEQLKQKLGFLSERYSKSQIQAWTDMVDHQHWKGLIESLLLVHYDPAYRQSSARNDRVNLSSLMIPKLDSRHFETAAETLQTIANS